MLGFRSEGEGELDGVLKVWWVVKGVIWVDRGVDVDGV